MSITLLNHAVSKISGKVPLRTVLVVPFVLQIVVAVGLVGYLSFRNGQKAVNDVATRLQREISDRIQENLQTYLATPHQINQSNAVAIRLGQMKVQDLAMWELHFLEQIKIFDSVSSIVLGSERKGFIGVEVRQDVPLVVMRSDETTGYTLETDTVNRNSNTTNVPTLKRLSTKANYDPRLRPWYTAAVQAKQPTWSAIFPQFETKNLNLAAVLPVYNRKGKLEGVLNSSLHLIDVGDFLSQLKIGKTGQGFIIDRDGMLVATSTQEKLARLNQDKVERLKASESSNALTQATAKYLLKNFVNLNKIATVQTLDFRLDGKRQFLQVLPFRDQFGLDWLIVVVVPEADFMEQINANTRTTILLCLVALLVASGVGILTARWVVKPILDLNRSAQALSRGEWEQKVALERTDEVGQLQASFNSMARQLQASFAEMKALNEQLSKSERRLTQFIEAMPVGVFVAEPNGKPYYTNQVGQQILGQGVVESATVENLPEVYQAYLAGSDQLYPPERNPIASALKGKSVMVDDMELRLGDKVVAIESLGTPIYDESGKIIYGIATFADITQRKQAEKLLAQYNHTLEQEVEERTEELEREITERKRTEVALLHSETQNRAILAAIPDLMFRVNADGIYLGYFATQELVDLLPPEFDPVGKHLSEFLPLDVHSRHLQHLQQALTTGKSQVYEQQNWIHGKRQYEEVRVVVSGEKEVLFMIRDISDRKKLEEELIQSEKMAALGQLIAGIAHEINTPLGAIRSSAGNIFKFLEHILEQLPSLLQSLSPKQQEDFFALVKRSLKQETTFSTKQERQFKKAIARQLDASDIENATAIADTLVTMGIYGEIDEFLPLLKMPNSLYLLETAYRISGLQRSTTTINIATNRASKVVFALKTYARYDSSGEMILANLTDGIETVLTLYNNQLKQGVEVIRNYVELPLVLCYPDELNQVWTNLIHNAIQAMNNQGTLTIDVTQQDQEVKVSITDSGKGIPAEIQPKIFEPFFTTKPSGEGSGLGLDIVRKIIIKHSGKITVESQPGQTTFSVLLPIQPNQEMQDV